MALLRLDFIDYATEIEAPVEKVFAFFKEVEKWPSWTTAIKKACCKSKGEWRKGFRLSFVPQFLPIPTEIPLVEYEEGRVIAWGMTSPIATVIHRFDFEPIDDQRCRVIHTEYAEGFYAILLRLMKNKITEFDRKFADDLQAVFSK
jgi:hypothetical protein